MSLKIYPNFVLNLSEREMKGETKHFYQFKSFRLDVEERQLLRDETAVPLTPKAFDVLALLVEQGGHLVERDKLLQTVWADSFVEEANITRTIHTLRKALGEDENGNKFIETVAKKGYRFVAEVEKINELADGSGSRQSDAERLPLTAARQLPIEENPPATTGGSDLKAKRNPRVILFGIGFLTAVFLLVFLSFNLRSDVQKMSRSIAVLPLKPITSNRDEIYELGIADSLIHRLGAMKGFFVRPLSATRKYADIEQDPIAAGREQQVDYVLASNYQLANGKIRVTAQLFNVQTGQIEETKIIEKGANDVFAAQDAIAGEVGNFLKTRFATTIGDSLAKRGTTNEEAYRLYLQGTNLTGRRTAADAKKAIEYFEQAIRLDPNFARAYSGIAYAYRATGTFGGGLPREKFELAKNNVAKALELDPNLAEAYAVRGDLKHRTEFNSAEAEKDLLYAIELDPNNDLAHQIYADVLMETGRFEQALTEIETTLAINPASLAAQRNRGRFFYLSRRYDEAIVELKRVLEVDANFRTAYDWLWLAYVKKGDEVGAFEWFLKEQKLKNPERADVYQMSYESGGWQAVLRQSIEFEKSDAEKPSGSYYRTARLYSLLNEKDAASEYLNKTFEKGQSQLIMLKIEPVFDNLRADPRFDELVKRVELK